MKVPVDLATDWHDGLELGRSVRWVGATGGLELGWRLGSESARWVCGGWVADQQRWSEAKERK